MYMKNTVGVGELRQNLSRYLRRVERGERLVVTDRNRPVAELGPPASTGAELDRLIVEGRVSPPRRSGLPEPMLARRRATFRRQRSTRSGAIASIVLGLAAMVAPIMTLSSTVASP